MVCLDFLAMMEILEDLEKRVHQDLPDGTAAMELMASLACLECQARPDYLDFREQLV